MLRPASYFVIDFETTWLDTTHDEPVQIGIVQFDHTFTITHTYRSTIRPKDTTKELASIVQGITGLTIEQLSDAPTLETVAAEIAPFFTQPRVMIGHNVAFDVAMLQKLLPVSPDHTIDTFPLAKTVFHFLPSYALDVVHRHLPATFQKATTQESYHDALTDCFASYDVFRYALEQITHVRRTYRVLDALIQNSTCWFKEYLVRTEKQFHYQEKQLFFPPLKKPWKIHKKIQSTIVPLPTPSTSMYSIANSSLKQLLSSLDTNQKRLILAFDSYNKVQLAQQLCQQLYLSATSDHTTRIFDPERVNYLLQQSPASYDEILFVAKYFLQFERQDTQVDCNSTEMRRIYHAITFPESVALGSLHICTHHEIFAMSTTLSATDTVLFLDADWRIESLQSRHHMPYYPERMLGILDDLLYYYSLGPHTVVHDQLLERTEKYTIMLAALYQETEQFFSTLQGEIELDTFLDNPRCPKVRNVIERLTASITDILPALLPEHAQTIAHTRDRLITILRHPCSIQVVQNRTQNAFVYRAKDTYVEWADLLSMAHQGQRYFLSTKPQLPAFLPSDLPTKPAPSTQLVTIASPDQVIASLGQEHCYILSANKDASQKLYNTCIKKGLHNRYTLLAENITGGAWKNLYMLEKSTKPICIIGGYKFLYAVLAKKVALSRIIVYYLAWPMNEQIMRDLYRYL